MEPTEGILSACQAPERQLPCSPFRSLSSRTVWRASGGELPTSSASFTRLVRRWLPPHSSRHLTAWLPHGPLLSSSLLEDTVGVVVLVDVLAADADRFGE